MATLKSIRKRIGSVKNTQKITKAMKMVAAAKLRRSQMAVVAARPYAKELSLVIQTIASDSSEHPIFRRAENPKRAAFLLYTSNRGLCGGFNSNLLRKTETFIRGLASYELLDIKVIGKKGRDFYKARNRSLAEVYLDYAERFPFEEAMGIAKGIIDQFLNEDTDEFYLVYNEFKSAISQDVTIRKLLPLETRASENLVEPLFEPSRGDLLDAIIPKYVATQLYRAHLESVASELRSRMTAMENATKNASEMIGKLTLQYNRKRQAVITTELMDIVNGAEAIK